MSLMDHKARSERGQALQAEVCAEVVAAATTPFEESLRDFVYAEVWSRPGLDRRARYLVSLAGAVLAGADAELVEGYARGALHGGHLSLRELREAALHLAVYGGWSRGRQLDRAVTAAAGALGLPAADCPAIRGEDWDPEARTREGMAEFTSVMTFPGGPSATPYLEAINNFVFGEMWQRYDGLDQRSRRWITLVGVCESSTETPIKSHIHAAMASGNCKPDEMQEFVLQYGIHAGWPKASIVQSVVIEMSRKVADGLPWNG
jgi:4-carboxymuconolactone decarboxylase